MFGTSPTMRRLAASLILFAAFFAASMGCANACGHHSGEVTAPSYTAHPLMHLNGGDAGVFSIAVSEGQPRGIVLAKAPAHKDPYSNCPCRCGHGLCGPAQAALETGSHLDTPPLMLTERHALPRWDAPGSSAIRGFERPPRA